MKRITDIPTLSPRPRHGHKGTFGKVLVIGGSVGFSGAPALTAKAALRSGAGLVRVAVPNAVQPVVAGYDPCYTTIALPDDADGQLAASAIPQVLQCSADNDVVAFGPGTGTGRGVREVLTVLMQAAVSLVIDADGLNVLAAMRGGDLWRRHKRAKLILTPHPGEMKRLWGAMFRESMPTERPIQAARLAEHTGSVVVLKGADTVVADGRHYYVNTTGNPGMATAGAGDVLTGVIAALCGQGFSPFDAAVAGVYLHGVAGDRAAAAVGQVGMTAIDIIDALKDAFSDHGTR